jgi:eukaryotic-like serine/threonine-protein kinase
MPTSPAAHNETLERLAARIADEEPVDWHGTADGRDPAVQGLREFEQVVNGFRHVRLANGSDTPRASRFRFGGLTVVEPLGAGSQGEVWRAYDPLLDLHVALKLRKVESGALSHQFLEEARRLARVRQANIVSVYGAAVHDGRAGLWTELVRGNSLAELLAQHGLFPAEETRSVGLDLCHALAAVHRHGLLHGDIKLENVMREVSGRIVLMDFGAARELDAAQTPVISGSLHYLAPEVMRGAAPSPASDIYALGVVLFRLLTGAFPYAAADLQGLLAAQDRGARTRLVELRPGLPKALVRAVERALEAEPARRHADAAAFATALAAPEAKPLVGWRGIGLAAALAALVATGVSMGYSVWRGVTGAEWQAEMAFHRIDARGSAVLSDGAPIRVGDRLALSFHSSRPAYVYVFDDDGSGEAAVLFPLPGIEPANPLAANTAYQLPGKSVAQALTWQVSSSAEREQFVIVAADQPQPRLEQAIAAWHRAGESASTRGALGLAPAPAETEISSASLRAELDRLGADTAHVRSWYFVFPHSSG